jgi:ribosomal subunit interface protein
MNIQIYGKNFKVTESIDSYIRDKYYSVEKIVSSVDKVHVSLSVNQHHKHGEIFTVSTQAQIDKHPVHVTETAEDLYAAVDKTQELLLRHARKSKTKNRSRWRRTKRLLSPRNYVRLGKKIFRR